VQVQPRHESADVLREAWRRADAAGLDSIWLWDHLLPPHRTGEAPMFESWMLLSAMAVDTRRAALGVLVSCAAFRNPDLLADMARTCDHLSGGRVVVGLGSGWHRREFEDYGYPFADRDKRSAQLEETILRVRARLLRSCPRPLGRMPILVGGEGESTTLELAARHADMWNGHGPPSHFRSKVESLDRHCARLGRQPDSIERTVLLFPPELRHAEEFVAAGADHLIVRWSPPFRSSVLTLLVGVRERLAGAAGQ
jgi:probable F420-dependent oxidoreductase